VIEIFGGSGGSKVKARTFSVDGTATGVLTNVRKYLPVGSTWVKATGLTGVTIASNGDASMASAIGTGSSLTGTVTGTFVDGSGNTQTVTYTVTLTGRAVAAAAPTVTLTAGNGQVSVAWVDGSNGGSAITSHRIYFQTSAGVTVASESVSTSASSPYILNWPNGDDVFVKVAAINGVGPSSLSTEQSATPSLAQWSLPSYFTRKVYFPVALVENGDGTFDTDFSPATFRATGGPYYVDDVNGLNVNDGLSLATAWKDLSKLFTTAPDGSLCWLASTPNFYLIPTVAEQAGKSITIRAINPADKPFLMRQSVTAANITSVSAPDGNGRQTVTLTSGNLQGFVDRTKLEYGYHQVSKNAANSAGLLTLRAAGKAGIYRTTNSIVTTSDASGRDISAEFGTTILGWSTPSGGADGLGSSQRKFSPSAGKTIMLEDVRLCGEVCIDFTTGRVIRYNTDFIGCYNGVEQAGTIGASVYGEEASLGSVSMNIGCKGTDAGDILDLNNYCWTNRVRILDANTGNGDQAITQHFLNGMFVNSDLQGSSSAITGENGRHGIFGGTLAGTYSTILEGSIAGRTSIDAHIKGVTFTGTPSLSDISARPLTEQTALYDYDGSTTGKTVSGGGSVINRSTGRPSTAISGLRLDASLAGTRFQDTAGTVLAGPGDPVLRINCSVNAGTYIKKNAGTATVNAGGGWIDQTGAVWELVSGSSTLFGEACQIIAGIRSSDTTFVYLGINNNIRNTAHSAFIDFRGTGDPYANCRPAPISQEDGWRVDGSATKLTTAPSVKSAAMNGADHVLTAVDVDLLWTPWREAYIFSNGSTGTNCLDGRFYYFEILWNNTAPERRAREVYCASLMTGVTIP
jgi:hypothetical protein